MRLASVRMKSSVTIWKSEKLVTCAADAARAERRVGDLLPLVLRIRLEERRRGAGGHGCRIERHRDRHRHGERGAVRRECEHLPDRRKARRQRRRASRCLIDCDLRHDCERTARNLDLRAVRPEHRAARGTDARRRRLRRLRAGRAALVVVSPPPHALSASANPITMQRVIPLNFERSPDCSYAPHLTVTPRCTR